MSVITSVIGRELAEAVFQDAVAACDPAARVRDALADPALASRLEGRKRFGIAIGKAALASEESARKTAQELALDVAAYDQRGCLSPHMAWAVRGAPVHRVRGRVHRPLPRSG